MEPQPSPRVSIVMINWNSWQDTIECLESLRNVIYRAFEIVIVDNFSTDDSVERISAFLGNSSGPGTLVTDPTLHSLKITKFPASLKETNAGPNIFRPQQVTLIRTGQNLGFAGGNNVGIRYAQVKTDPEFILLLNNDTVVDPHFLTKLVDSSVKWPEKGFFGPKIYYYDYLGRKDIVNFAGGSIDYIRGLMVHRGIGEEDNDAYSQPFPCDWVQGACMLVRSRAIAETGLLDETYFLYWEEIDWCIRGKKKGWGSVVIPDSKIWHKIGKSSGDLSTPVPMFYGTRNRIIFMKKNADSIHFLIFFLYYFGIHLPVKSFQLGMAGKNPGLMKIFLKGSIAGLRYVFFKEYVLFTSKETDHQRSKIQWLD